MQIVILNYPYNAMQYEKDLEVSFITILLTDPVQLFKNTAVKKYFPQVLLKPTLIYTVRAKKLKIFKFER